MKGKTLKYVILLATISVIGIFVIQFSFLKSSYNYSEKQFRESAAVALKEVAWQLLLASGNTANFDSITPVDIISNNFYVVNIDAPIDRELLKKQLIEELRRHEIFSDFEFAIYNPASNLMEDAMLVEKEGERKSDYRFPVVEEYSSYFQVHFPNRLSFFNSNFSVWYFFTGLLLVVVLFFGYTLSVIIRQRQLSEVQKNFINNLTHELKTPISSIGLASGVINNEEILNNPKRLFKYARIIEEQNRRLSDNVEKVLNLASLEKNRIHLNLESIGLQQIIDEVLQQFKQTDLGRKATILVSGDRDFTITADRFHFSNLLMNILENGVKYSEKKPVLEIKTGIENGRLKLSISDNGIGIAKDQQKKIFKKFYRVPTGNVHNVKGFGLGLDYVKKIVQAHKWKITVSDRNGGGSIFSLIIPHQNKN